MSSMNRYGTAWCAVIFIFLIFFISFSFAQKKASAWGDAKKGIVLSYRPNPGDIFDYERIMEDTNTMERMGQSLETTSSSKYAFQIETEQVDSLIHFVLILDTVSHSFKGPQGAQAIDFGDIKGKKIRASITLHGDQKDLVPIDSLPTPKLGDQPMEGDAKGWFSLPLFKVPDRPMKIGDSWTDAKRDTTTQIDSTRQSTRTYIKNSKTQYTVLGEETKLGLACLHLQVETQYSSQSRVKTSDSQISAEGDGETKGQAWFAYKEGILVEFSYSGFYEGTTAITGPMNLTSPNIRESKFSLRLLNYKPVKK